VTNDAELAHRIDKIAFPGLTANFDAAKSAALAVTMLDWKVAGREYAAAMKATAGRLAEELLTAGQPVFAGAHGPCEGPSERSPQAASQRPDGVFVSWFRPTALQSPGPVLRSYSQISRMRAVALSITTWMGRETTVFGRCTIAKWS
jgi:hypothetical protein